MIKRLTLFFALFFSLSAWSQSNDLSNGICIVGGAGLSHVFSGANLSSGFGYSIGIERNVSQFSDHSLINAGITFSQHSVAYSQTPEVEPYNTLQGDIKLSYVNVPLLYRYQFEKGLFLELGIQPGFLVGAKDKPDEGSETDIKEHIKFVDLGFPIGVGYWIGKRVSIGARAVFGLTNLSTQDFVFYDDNPNHQNLMVNGVVRVNLGK